MVLSTREEMRSMLEDFASSATTAHLKSDPKTAMQEFFQVLSEIPNFPCLEKPGERESSPSHIVSSRHKVMQVLKSADVEQQTSCLREIFLQSLAAKKRPQGKNHPTKEAPRHDSSEVTSAATNKCNHNNITTNNSLSLFTRFKMKVKANGGFILRQNIQEGTEITVINDYDPLTGEFKVGKFS